MAKKEREVVELKKGASEFMLVGKLKLNNNSFTLDKESSKATSDWVGNFLNIGVDCGGGNVVYAGMMGGYGSTTKIYAHGKKLRDGTTDKFVDDFKNRFTVEWEDRFDEDTLEEVGNRNFIMVGIEKDTKDKIVTKRFLSEYDAIAYMEENKEHLADCVVRVSGRLVYQEYQGEIQTKKEIRSIFVSKAKEEDFGATFKQTILIDKRSVGKNKDEDGLLDLDVRVVDYDSGKKRNIVFSKIFKIQNENLKKFLKVKKDITEITMLGNIVEGQATAELDLADLDDDLQELIDLGLYTKEDLADKMAIRGKRVNNWIVTAPDVRMVGQGDEKVPQIQKTEERYKEDELLFDEMELEKEENIEEVDDADFDDDDLDDFLDAI